MTLRKAQEQLKRLDNEYRFWLNEKELAQSIVLPKATDIGTEGVDGGTREDKMLKYVEVLENKQIDETLEYIFKKRQNLMNYIEEELRIIGQYSLIEKRIYDLRSEKVPWWKVGNIVGLSDRQCKRIYSKMQKKRNI